MSSLPSSPPHPGRVRPVTLAFALCLWLVSTFTSCRHLKDATPEERALAGSILNSRRADSLSSWKDKTVGGEPIMGYTLLRTAVLLPPDIRMSVRSERTGDVVRFDAKFRRDRQRGLFSASAAAVTRDGYFLTAAHCLDEGACTLVAIDRTGTLRAVPARIVWCGQIGEGGPDLGLIHAPINPAGTLPLTNFAPEPKGLPLFTGGFGAHGLPEIKAGGSGGYLVHTDRVQQLRSGARWRNLYHDAPLAPGDSGGPVIDEKGRLLGISTEVRGRWSGLNGPTPALTNYRGVAVSPDAAWIQSLINRDRASGGVSARP